MPSLTHHTGTLKMKSLAFFSATLAVALPLIDAHSAQAKTSVKSAVQTSKKRDRSARISPKLPSSQIIQPRSPQPLPMVSPIVSPIVSPMTVSYVYSAPYSAPSGSDRPICFIERSDGTFMDLSKLCGTKANPDLNFNSNSTMPSYPIYPEDRQPQ